LKLKVHRTDFLVLGSGIAGLSFALKVAPMGRVILMTKKEDSESSTNYAQGGIATVIEPDDSTDSHYEDTVQTGCGLCHSDAVKVLVTEGPDRVKELVKWGVRFSYERDEGGKRRLSLGREGGHSKRRIVRADDLTGQEIERALLTRLMRQSDFYLFEDHFASDLIVEDLDDKVKRCLGVLVYNRHTDDFEAWIAPVTLMATGGAGQVYPHTTNPENCHGRWYSNGLQGRCKNRQYGVHPIPSHSTLSSRGKGFSHIGGGPWRGSRSTRQEWASIYEKISSQG